MSKSGKTIVTIVLVLLIIALIGFMMYAIRPMGMGFGFVPNISCSGINLFSGTGRLPSSATKGNSFEVAANEANSVYLDFINEEVIVKTWDRNSILVEQQGTNLSDDNLMRFGVQNGEFIAQSGMFNKAFFGVHPASTITLYLPQNFGKPADISTTSGNISMGSNIFISLSASSTSGNVNLKDVACETLDANSTSGNIIISSRDMAQQVNIDSVSGNVDFNGNSESLEASTVSGRIIVEGDISDVSTSSTSGTIQATLITPTEFSADSVSGNVSFSAENASALEKVEIDTVTGRADVDLPENAGFNIDFDSISGNLKTSGFMMNGNMFGNGKTKIAVNTASSDLNIQ